MPICEHIKKTCPEASACYRRLKLKREATAAIYKRKSAYQYVIDFDLLLRLTARTYGKIQTAELSVEPPSDETIRTALLNSFIGLTACIYARYYCERGFLQNDFVTLYGPGGLGKSTYAWYLVDMLGGVLLTKEDDVLTAIFKLYMAKDWKPIVVLDDIAAIISKYWHMDKTERIWSKLFKALEYAKDFTGILMTTARSFEGQPKRFRDLVSIRGEVKRFLIGNYIVDVIEWRRASTPRNTPPEYIDVLWPGLRLPEERWKRMIEHRRLRSEILLLETMLELAKTGQIDLTEDEIEKITEKIQALKRKLQETTL